MTSLPQSAKTQSLEQEKNPGKKADDYQSSVARYIVQNHACALAYNDRSFRVICVCSSKSCLDVMEALYIRSRKPDLCAQKTSINTLHLFRPLSTLFHPFTTLFINLNQFCPFIDCHTTWLQEISSEKERSLVASNNSRPKGAGHKTRKQWLHQDKVSEAGRLSSIVEVLQGDSVQRPLGARRSRRSSNNAEVVDTSGRSSVVSLDREVHTSRPSSGLQNRTSLPVIHTNDTNRPQSSRPKTAIQNLIRRISSRKLGPRQGQVSLIVCSGRSFSLCWRGATNK